MSKGRTLRAESMASSAVWMPAMQSCADSMVRRWTPREKAPVERAPVARRMDWLRRIVKGVSLT